MGEVLTDEPRMKSIPKSVVERHAEIQQQFERKKEEKLEEGSNQQQVNYFLDTFGNKQREIVNVLDEMEKGERSADKENLPECFDKLSKEVQSLNRFFSTATVYLTVFNIRKYKQALEDLQARCQDLEEKLLPKKKFGFKGKKTGKRISTDVKKEGPKKDVMDGVVKNGGNVWWKGSRDDCGFYSRRGEFLQLSPGQVEGKDVELSDIHDCTVVLFGAPSTLRVTGIYKTKIFTGPVSTSVFVENCNDCTLVFACQQLRVHATRNCRFYIHVTSRAIIEDSDSVQFAPFNLSYEGLREDFIKSGLDMERNNWDSVDDFNWLAQDVPSPNWKVIDPGERVADWNSTLQDIKGLTI